MSDVFAGIINSTYVCTGSDQGCILEIRRVVLGRGSIMVSMRGWLFLGATTKNTNFLDWDSCVLLELFFVSAQKSSSSLCEHSRSLPNYEVRRYTEDSDDGCRKIITDLEYQRKALTPGQSWELPVDCFRIKTPSRSTFWWTRCNSKSWVSDPEMSW